MGIARESAPLLVPGRARGSVPPPAPGHAPRIAQRIVEADAAAVARGSAAMAAPLPAGPTVAVAKMIVSPLAAENAKADARQPAQTAA